MSKTTKQAAQVEQLALFELATTVAEQPDTNAVSSKRRRSVEGQLTLHPTYKYPARIAPAPEGSDGRTVWQLANTLFAIRREEFKAHPYGYTLRLSRSLLLRFDPSFSRDENTYIFDRRLPDGAKNPHQFSSGHPFGWEDGDPMREASRERAVILLARRVVAAEQGTSKEPSCRHKVMRLLRDSDYLRRLADYECAIHADRRNQRSRLKQRSRCGAM